MHFSQIYIQKFWSDLLRLTCILAFYLYCSIVLKNYGCSARLRNLLFCKIMLESLCERFVYPWWQLLMILVSFCTASWYFCLVFLFFLLFCLDLTLVFSHNVVQKLVVTFRRDISFFLSAFSWITAYKTDTCLLHMMLLNSCPCIVISCNRPFSW